MKPHDSEPPEASPPSPEQEEKRKKFQRIVFEPPAKQGVKWRRIAVDALVVVILGVVLCVVLGGRDYWWSVQRRRQERTMADMRSLGTGLGSYQVDYSGFPTANGLPTEAFKFLDPDYMVSPPTLDGWGRPFRYFAPPSDHGFAQHYTLQSAGSDGLYQGYIGEPTLYFSCDLIYTDAHFIARP